MIFLEESCLTNIRPTYFQMTGTPLRSGGYCYGSRRRKLWFQAIRDSSGHSCSNISFM